MTRDVRAAYDQAAKGAGDQDRDSGRRDLAARHADRRRRSNPYDGIDAGKLNLWTYDSYHASTHGYYLQALVIFGTLTGRDPRSLGDNECSAYELGMSRAEVTRAAAGRVRSDCRHDQHSGSDGRHQETGAGAALRRRGGKAALESLED